MATGLAEETATLAASDRELLALMLVASAESVSVALQGDNSAERHPALAALSSLREFNAAAEDAAAVLVRQAKEAGCSWADVGAALGVTRQAAFQRYGEASDEAVSAEVTTLLAGARRIAVRVLSCLWEGSYEEMRAVFDATMLAACPVAMLSDLRESLQSELGDVKRTGRPRARVLARYIVVDVPLHFGSGDRIGRVAIDGSRVAGLFILQGEQRHGH